MREEIVEPNIKYSRIGESRRTKLIDLVIRQGYKIVRASKMLKINQSTAKSILKLYRQTGTYSVKPKAEQQASIRQKKTIAREKAQQQSTLNGNTQIQQNVDVFCRSQTSTSNYYQSSYCMYPTYFPSLYIVFPNTTPQE